jgi:hypothetical protein
VSHEITLGRRELLGASLSAAALVAFGGLLPAGCHRYPEAPPGLRFFNAQEFAVFREAAQVLLGLSGDASHVAVEVDRLVATMDRSVKRDIRWMLRLFEHGTRVFELKGRRFTGLSRAEQERYVTGWMDSSMGARRLVFRALKLIAALGYYGRPEAWPSIGYAGPWLGRRHADRRVSYESPVPLASIRRG